MSELHKTSTFKKSDLHRGFVSGNKVPNKVLSDRSLKALVELSEVLKPIYIRMRKDGYVIIEGRLVKKNENE